MTTSSFIKGFILALVLSVAGDYLWHNVLFVDLYTSKLAAIGGGAVPDFSPSLIALEVLASAISTYFVLAAAKKGTVQEGALHGGLLGFAMVGAINFLNNALFAGWDTTIMTVDIAFGIVLGAVIGAGIVMVTKKR